MQNIKTGKEEIIYLLNRAIDKYKTETGQRIVQNTNRKNYESLAILLSEISNQLPLRFEEFGTEPYSPEVNPKGQGYPHRKYDITGGQIKDALIGIVANPRPFLVDACYIYLYGIGRKAFKQNPLDENLFESFGQNKKEESSITEKEKSELRRQISYLENQNIARKKIIKIISLMMVVISVGIIALYLSVASSKQK